MLKTTKNAITYTLIISVISLLVNLITSPKHVISIFEYGFWIGLGIYLTSIITIFIVIFLILFLKRTLLKFKK